MAEFDTAPPNTHAGGNDNALLTSRALPVNPNRDLAAGDFDAEAYMAETPKWKRIWQHSLTQMLLLAVQAFCGPAMTDAIAGLGGGGLATPQTSNIAVALNYGCLAIICIMGGPIINKLGNKWCLVLGACSFPIRGSSYYCNSKFGNQWYLIMGAVFTGTGSGFWYIAEAGSILTIAPSGARGKYLALWIVSRNLGQLVGGAINLAKNAKLNGAGGITTDTYIAFLIIECMALPFAFLVAPIKDVVRSDGTRILVSAKQSTKQEFKRIRFTVTSKLVLLIAPWAFWSFFYSGTWSTYLATHFSTRARALSSLISPFFCIVGCFGLGFILDLKGFTQRRRAQMGFVTVVVLNVAVYIWSIIMEAKFDKHSPGKIDWTSSLYPSAFLPYFFVQTTGPLSQSYGFWLLSSFATDAQSNFRNGAMLRALEGIGQAIAYGINTKTKTTPNIGFGITFGLLGLAIVPTLLLVNSVPDRIPADVTVEEQDRAAHTAKGESIEEVKHSEADDTVKV